jgi:hypothetical protein
VPTAQGTSSPAARRVPSNDRPCERLRTSTSEAHSCATAAQVFERPRPLPSLPFIACRCQTFFAGRRAFNRTRARASPRKEQT